MAKVKFGDVVRETKGKVDRNNNPYEFYVAGDHIDSEDLTIHRHGCFATDDVGPAFIREFKRGQVLYGSRRTYLKKVAVADFDGVTANTTFVLETKDQGVLMQELLPFIMLSEGFTAWSVGKSKGSTNPYVLFSDLADYEFELPPIALQKELSDLLWQMFRLQEQYSDLSGRRGNREQEWRLPRTFRYCTSCSGLKGLTSCRGNLPLPFPANKNAVAADCRRYRAFRDSILHFRRGNVPFVLAATFRARLFLFPVDCSLFPLYYPLLFHQQLDKSEFPSCPQKSCSPRAAFLHPNKPAAALWRRVASPLGQSAACPLERSGHVRFGATPPLLFGPNRRSLTPWPFASPSAFSW